MYDTECVAHATNKYIPADYTKTMERGTHAMVFSPRGTVFPGKPSDVVDFDEGRYLFY